jgi:aquaporin Z
LQPQNLKTSLNGREIWSMQIGTEASLGANAPDYSYPLALVFGVEVLATALLMAVIYLVVYTKGLRGLGGLAIGGWPVLIFSFLHSFQVHQ